MLQPHEHFLLRTVKLPSLFLGRAESQREVMSAFHGKEQYMKTFQINLTFTRNAVGCINFRYAGKQEIIFHVDDVSIPFPPPQDPYGEKEEERFCLLMKSNCGARLGRGRVRGRPATWASAPRHVLERADPSGSIGHPWSLLFLHRQDHLVEGGGSWAGGKTLLPAAVSGEGPWISSSVQAKLTKSLLVQMVSFPLSP